MQIYWLKNPLMTDLEQVLRLRKLETKVICKLPMHSVELVLKHENQHGNQATLLSKRKSVKGHVNMLFT